MTPAPTPWTKGDDGGPAFPVPESTDGEWADPKTCKQLIPFRGMSLRDYFAIHAPAQFGDDTDPKFAHERTLVPLPTDRVNGTHWGKFWSSAEAVARYQFADAMLAARTARGETP